MKKLVLLLVAALGGALAAAPALASPIAWNIVNGSISVGASLSGGFTVDVDNTAVTPFDVTAGSYQQYVISTFFGTDEGQTYSNTTAGDTASLSNADGTLQFDEPSGILLTLNFQNPLSDAGGTDPFTGSYDTYFDAAQGGITYADFTISGDAQAASVVTPEPGTWVLLATGLMALAGLAVKRRGLCA